MAALGDQQPPQLVERQRARLGMTPSPSMIRAAAWPRCARLDRHVVLTYFFASSAVTGAGPVPGSSG
jgi:hypothetical protein